MSADNTCPRCGTRLADPSLKGRCPTCLARYSFLELDPDPVDPSVHERVEKTVVMPAEHDLEVGRTGMMIGRYKVLEQIGEGGFGVVYMAEQVEPVQRKVALKVVKAGMDTKAVVARFEAERQALALMDHPNIARVLDAGTTGAGRPYFVMELVRGIPITEFCDQKKLSTTERLDLFITVCHAVQHAHQKGIIHRDLKPGNVLVTLHDGKPVAKVIDFGVAKALGQRLTEKTLFTGFAQLIGTPAYMSPEQAEMSGLDVDTRSDIYSLGVLLYELITGVTPFDRETLAKAALDEIRRMIREADPPKPSTRLTELVAADMRRLASTAEAPGPSCETERASVRRRLQDRRQTIHLVRGDLDWIVMKCLEKDRTRRYETANGVAMDLKRHLGNEPIMACPPSKLYEFRKTVRRHKAGFAAAAMVMCALAAGLALATVAWRREREARERSVIAEELATAEARRSGQVSEFLADMLSATKPSVARGRDTVLLREVLQRATERVEEELAGQPEIQGDLWVTLAGTYQSLGDRSRAAKLFERAAERYRSEPGPPNTKLARTLGRLGFNQSYLTRMETGKSNALHGLEMARELDDEKTLADCLYYAGRACRAYGMGSSEGRPYFEEALAIYREIDDRSLSVAKCLSMLAVCDIRDEESVASAREALEIREEHYEPDHPTLAETKFVLGQVLICQGEVEEAERVLTEALSTWERVQDDGKPGKHFLRRFLAVALAMQGKWSEAHAVMRGNPEVGGSLDRKYRHLYYTLVTRLVWLDRPEEATAAVSQFRQLYEDLLLQHGPLHPEVSYFFTTLLELYEMTEQFEQATQFKQDAAKELLQLAENSTTSPPIEQMNALAWSMVSGGDPGSRDPGLARQLATRSVEAAPTNGTYWNTLGVAHYRAGNSREALDALEMAAELQSAGGRFDESVLAMIQWQLGHQLEARKTFDRAEDWLRTHSPHDDAQHQFHSEAVKLLQTETHLECVRRLQ